MVANGVHLLAETYYIVLHVVMRSILPRKLHLILTEIVLNVVHHGLGEKKEVH